MSLYFVIFGSLIGSRIGEMGGFDYMSFIVPGLIMMSVITNSYSNVASSFFSAKWQRNVEEMLVAPVPNWVIVAGYVGGGISIIPTFILTPLTYLGGVFYSISLLPEFWQGVSQINPIVYMVNAFRYGFLGISDVSLTLSFGVLGVFIVSLYTIAMVLITKGIGLRS